MMANLPCARRHRGTALGTVALLLALAAACPAGAQTPAPDGAVAERLRRAGIAVNERTLGGADSKLGGSAADALARTYPLPPATLALRDRLPPDPEATMDALKLRRHPRAPVTPMPANATRTDMRDALVR